MHSFYAVEKLCVVENFTKHRLNKERKKKNLSLTDNTTQYLPFFKKNKN